MPVTVKNCPLCSNQISTTFDQRQFRGQMVTNCICSNCGLVYQSPRMSEDDLPSFYSEEYRQLYQGSEGPTPKDLAVQAARAEALLAFIMPKVQKISRHLDIGCSAGLFLKRLQDTYTCHSAGVEPSIAYRQYTQANGLKVFASIEECRYALRQAGEAPFDLVSLVHVLEHLPDPVSYLSDISHHFLAERGWLLVEVPNLYGHDCFEIAHLISYSPHTLAQTLQQAGYEIQNQEVHGRPRSTSIPLYITTLSITAAPSRLQTLPKLPIPERTVKRKRQIAMLHRRLVTQLDPKRAWLPLTSPPGLHPKK